MPTAHRIKRGLAIVPENRRLFGPMTVLENLEMGAYLRPKADLKEEFERVYSLFPLLYERRAQLAGTLSGGEQQMVAMGRALMSQPKLLLMDEPSMGLAPVLVERSFEIIKQVNDSGVAMLVVEQNANVSLSIADRGYVLSTGRDRARGKGRRPARGRGSPQGVPRAADGRRQRRRADPAAARLRARARDAAPRARERRREVGDAGHDVLLFAFARQRAARWSGARDGLGGAVARRARRPCSPPAPTGVSLVRVTLGADTDLHAPMGAREHVVAIDAVEPGKATGSRSFQILFGPHNGSRRATMFVGYVPPGKAPWHYHLYDEIVWIWRGPGRYHLGDDVEPLEDGSAFRITPREVHIVENTHPDRELAVLGIFTPAGSPSAAYLTPDDRRHLRVRAGVSADHRQGRRGDPGRVPDLRAQDLPQLLLAGRAVAPRAGGLRGVPRRLGRERRRVGVLGRARRGGPRRLRRAAPRRRPTRSP